MDLLRLATIASSAGGVPPFGTATVGFEDVARLAASCLLPERNPTRRIRLEDFRQKARGSLGMSVYAAVALFV